MAARRRRARWGRTPRRSRPRPPRRTATCPRVSRRRSSSGSCRAGSGRRPRSRRPRRTGSRWRRPSGPRSWTPGSSRRPRWGMWRRRRRLCARVVGAGDALAARDHPRLKPSGRRMPCSSGPRAARSPARGLGVPGPRAPPSRRRAQASPPRRRPRPMNSLRRYACCTCARGVRSGIPLIRRRQGTDDAAPARGRRGRRAR